MKRLALATSVLSGLLLENMISPVASQTIKPQPLTLAPAMRGRRLPAAQGCTANGGHAQRLCAAEAR